MHYIVQKLLTFPVVFWYSKTLWAWTASIFSPVVKISKSTGKNMPFLLIVGSGRSGNTLLRRLMMEQFDIYIPPETYVLSKIGDYRIRARGLKWPSLVDLIISAFEYYPEFETFNINNLREFALKAKCWEKNEQTITNLITGLYSWMAEKSAINSSWLGDKTPLNTLHLRPIAKIIPNAKYIYMLRDGVDVSFSYFENRIYQNLEDAAFRWVRSHKSWEHFKKRLNVKEYIELRYEDLVMNPEAVIQKIKAKFDIPERSRVDISDLFRDVTNRSHHAKVFQPISVNFIGKGRHSLSEFQKKQLRPIINSTLSHAGYNRL